MTGFTQLLLGIVTAAGPVLFGMAMAWLFGRHLDHVIARNGGRPWSGGKWG